MSKSNYPPGEPFRAVQTLHVSPISLEGLANILLEEMVEFSTPATDRYLPQVTQVDSIRVITSTDGLDADVAEIVGMALAHHPAVAIIEGYAIKPAPGVTE